jgi:putative nucleotidyltransferase with HDIG domain
MFKTQDTSRLLRDKVLQELEKDSMVHSFSGAAQKLMQITQKEDVILAEIAEVVNMEAGLAARILRLANSIVYGGKSIERIEDALFRIGMEEIKRLSMAFGVVDRVSHLKIKVDWNMYWMHCLFVARVTDILVSAYRDLTGREYLAGLLHDVGKLFLEHHFPDVFETIIFRSMERGCGMDEVERQLYDITHAEVGALLGEKWTLHPDILRAIRFHHDPLSQELHDPASPGDERLLALCISLADALANICKTNIKGQKRYGGEISIETLPEWQNLQQTYSPIRELNLDLGIEIERVQQLVEAFQPFNPGPSDGSKAAA